MFELVVAGDATKQIADKLGVLISTVDYHLTRIYRHFKVGSRLELVTVLARRGET